MYVNHLIIDIQEGKTFSKLCLLIYLKCFSHVLQCTLDVFRRQSFGMHTQGKPNSSSHFTQVSAVTCS